MYQSYKIVVCQPIYETRKQTYKKIRQNVHKKTLTFRYIEDDLKIRLIGREPREPRDYGNNRG